MGRRAAAVRLRVTARRPASWLAAATAAGASWWLASAPGAWWFVAALLAGAALAAAALGNLPRERDARAWAGARVAWPVAGAVLGWLAGGTHGAEVAGPLTLIAACLAVAAGAARVARAGLPAVLAPPAPERDVGRVTGDAVPRAVMASALVGMVVCLFLVPHLAWGYAAIACGWLAAWAAPRAALGAGAAGDVARRLLVAAAAGPRARPARAAARLVMAHAAVLVWPPLVAAALAGTSSSALEPLAIAAVIAVTAAVLAAVVAAALAAGGSRDTALALALCVSVAGAAVAWAVVSGAISAADGSAARVASPGGC